MSQHVRKSPGPTSRYSFKSSSSENRSIRRPVECLHIYSLSDGFHPSCELSE
ncbi:hypothetical protein M378DRAFT_322114 [Amanita muscaria Koide BX008]|uniref:Uncharacterized protein n=1 Tax=Amanita muscaria (strain Koide BX008) TaxID=946122 RepID=A0A0C2SUA8_AMAMK|nr:hypothetical protein M378DRAFT_322114 [Amanita muscaria Koide BX008]